ncbi:DUF6596 domain-containing protein [Micromonospora radicis]|uniref:DUF6596 domain-containing protein n=1 Tax=Micromonospora radicis TaxID=1894971 RepID=UPI002D7A2BDB|nr:DUF6596 domain-containing protein [Micromonospora radicis]
MTAGVWWLHASSRSPARDRGRIVLLDQQDRRRWDRAAIGRAVWRLRSAVRQGRAGPYQVQAQLWHATHADLPATPDRPGEALVAAQRALELATNPAERELMSRRVGALRRRG